jgi:hypothetical protein
MAKYQVLAIEYGFNLNFEFITKTALESFSEAFSARLSANWGHRSNPDDFVPKVGEIVEAFVEDQIGYAIIDYNDEISEQLDKGRSFNVSIYAKCKSYWDDKGIRHIEEILFDDTNSIDIVPFGAIPHAQIQQPVAEEAIKVESFVMNSVKGIVSKIDSEPTLTERKDTMSDELKTEVLGAAEPIVSSSEPKVKSEYEKSICVAEIKRDAFTAGASAGLTQAGVEWVASQITDDSDVSKLVEIEKNRIAQIVNEVKEQLSAGAKSEKDTLSSGITINSNPENSLKPNRFDELLLPKQSKEEK